MTLGGEAAIQKYVKSLQEHIDFDIVPALCGKVVILPLHPMLPKMHRDPVFNQHMQSFYKNHDKGAQDILERMVKAREDSEKRTVEQLEKEAAEHGDHVKRQALQLGKVSEKALKKWGTMPKAEEAPKQIEPAPAAVEEGEPTFTAASTAVDEEDDAE